MCATFAKNNQEFLSGKLLIATPTISDESFFSRAVVYVVSHNENGAIGLVINHPLSDVNSTTIFSSFDIKPTTDIRQMPIYFGGPIEAERGFILHTNDYNKDPVFKFDNEISLSSSLQILQDIAIGRGPDKSIFALGYAGWQDGQLESEIHSNSWLTIPFSHDLVFASDNTKKWVRAMDSLGINHYTFTSQAGHA